MDNHFKMRCYRLFKSSLISCKSKNTISDFEDPTFIPHNNKPQSHQHYELIHHFSPVHPRPFPFMCRPKWPIDPLKPDDEKRLLASDPKSHSEKKKMKATRKSASKKARFMGDKKCDSAEAGFMSSFDDSLAVVKRSSNPYADFRTSMVEMIVEKQIFTAKELENLLQCFLCLNSYHHHKVIIQVFSEIWATLFVSYV